MWILPAGEEEFISSLKIIVIELPIIGLEGLGEIETIEGGTLSSGPPEGGAIFAQVIIIKTLNSLKYRKKFFRFFMLS